MAVSQGSAGGIPGLTLRGWCVVSGAGVLRKGSGVSAVARTAAGTYNITLSQATLIPAISQIYFAGGGDIPPRYYGGGNASAIQPVTFMDAGGTGLDRDFYVAFYE